MRAPFEADLEPETMRPRVRFNFANGWSASVVLLGETKQEDTYFTCASVAACPTGKWGTGVTELLSEESSPDEVSDLLFETSARSALQ